MEKEYPYTGWLGVSHGVQKIQFQASPEEPLLPWYEPDGTFIVVRRAGPWWRGDVRNGPQGRDIRTLPQAVASAMSAGLAWTMRQQGRPTNETPRLFLQASWVKHKVILFWHEAPTAKQGRPVWRGEWWRTFPMGARGGEERNEIDPTPRPPESNNSLWAIAHEAARRIGAAT